MTDVLLSKALSLNSTDSRLPYIRGVLGLPYDGPLDFSRANVTQLERIEDLLYQGVKDWERLAELYEIETRDKKDLCRISLKRNRETLTQALLADGFCKHETLRWAVHYQRHHIVKQLLSDETFEIDTKVDQVGFLYAMKHNDTKALGLFLDCLRFDAHFHKDAFLKHGLERGWYDGLAFVSEQLGGRKRKRTEQKFKAGDIVEALMGEPAKKFPDYVGTLYHVEVLEFDHKKQKYKCQILAFDGPRSIDYWPEEQLYWPRGTEPERRWKKGDRVDFKIRLNERVAGRAPFVWVMGTVVKVADELCCEVQFDNGELAKVFAQQLRMH